MQVAPNLVLNALEHTAAGDRAEVELRTAGARLRFVTRNPGAAIDAATRRRIFEPFVTAGGTGLGLALVARRVAELGGAIDVRCADGQVVFEVDAPLAADVDDSTREVSP